MTHIDEPVDRRIGIRAANGRRGRYGMDDVAERAEPDDENLVQEPLIRASRSRVE